MTTKEAVEKEKDRGGKDRTKGRISIGAYEN